MALKTHDSTNAPTILFVCSDDDLSQFAASNLKLLDYPVQFTRFEAQTGDAMRVLPDLALVDAEMADVFAHHVQKAGHSLREFKDTSVILLMRTNRNTKKIENLSIKINDYMHLPTSAQEFLAKVNTQLMFREARRELSLRNAQLDTTLENIDQGICFVDMEKRVILSNQKYAEIYRLPVSSVRPGMKLEKVLKLREKAGTGPTVSHDEYFARFDSLSDTRGEYVAHLKSGQVIKIKLQRTEDRGWVSTHNDITNEWYAQEELLKSREDFEVAASEAKKSADRLVDAFNVVPEGLALFDSEDRYLLWNSHYENLYVKSGDQIVRGTPFEATLRAGLERGQYPEAIGREEEWLQERLAQHRLGSSTHEQRLPDNRWIRIHERRTADGGSIGVRIDITDLKKREASFRLLFESNPVPMWVYDRQTLQFLDVNQAAVDHYGYDRREFLAMTLLDIRPKADWQAVCDLVAPKEVAQEERRVWRHIKADRSCIDVEIYATRLTYEEYDAALVAVIDITDRKRAEDELRTTQEFLHTVIESVPVTVFVKEAQQQRYVLVNRAGEEMVGIPREELIGKTAGEVFPQGIAQRVDALDSRLLASGQSEATFGELIETPHNGTRVVNSSAVAIRDTSGEPRYLLRVVDDVTERQEAEKLISHLTLHDPLTDLPNRLASVKKLDVLLENFSRSSGEFSVICLNIDRFKEFNDIHGHDVGDALLVEVGNKMKEIAGENFSGRLGGDEFIILASLGEQPTSSIQITDRLMHEFSILSLSKIEHLPIGASFGVAIFPGDGRDAKTLMANADAALSRAKNDGRKVVRFFEPTMDERIRKKRALQHELDMALSNKQLLLHYQPRARISGEIMGFEALLRWHHPKLGFVSPAEFIPVAEDTGLITEIGEWVLREACREAASWADHIDISVNLSPVQFRHGDLSQLVRDTLFQTGLSPNRLELEITESVLIGDFSHALSVLLKLKTIGVRIAMDDFGTGYSSLSYLRSFPFDRIKIDQSFVRFAEQPQSAAIIRAVIGLGRSLNLPVTAEGVETENQLRFLADENCDEVQGYLIGKPAPIDRYSQYVGRHRSQSSSEKQR